MWTPITRRRHGRKHLRYETDLTDEEREVAAPYFPASPARGGPHKWSMRVIVNAIFYVLRGGIAWILLPRELPPKSTVFHCLPVFCDTRLFEQMNNALVMADCERVGREASPSAAIIDRQSVKTTESGGPRCYDAGTKIKSRKRHALVDTDGRGLLLAPLPPRCPGP
jgi:transposase